MHWNKKYGTPDIAVDKPDGLAVLGLLIEVGDKPHQEFDKVIEALEKIPCKDDKTCLSKGFCCNTVSTSFSDTSYVIREQNL